MTTCGRPRVTDIPELRAAQHCRIIPPFAPDAGGFDGQTRILAEMVGAQAASLDDLIGPEPCAFVVCTTVTTSALDSITANNALFFDEIERICGRRPCGILHSYMCAGWGFAMRFFARHSDVRQLLIAIVDVDHHDFTYHRGQAAIGRNGFGVSAILVRLPENRATAVAEGPYPESAFKEFVRAIRAKFAEGGGRKTFIPFFRGELAAIAEKMVGADLLGVNRNAEYGHCFGADTWIGIIEWLDSDPPAAAHRVMAGAVAFNGYFTISDFLVLPDMPRLFHTVDGAVASLRQGVSCIREWAVARGAIGAPTSRRSPSEAVVPCTI